MLKDHESCIIMSKRNARQCRHTNLYFSTRSACQMAHGSGLSFQWKWCDVQCQIHTSHEGFIQHV